MAANRRFAQSLHGKEASHDPIANLAHARCCKEGGAALAGLSVLRLAGTGLRVPDPAPRRGHPLAGPARAEPRART